MSNIFVTSDHHYKHSFLSLDIRGFSSVEEHDEYMIDNWNKHISKRDVVYHLGDFFLGRAGDLKPILDRLNGTIHLITGNHERCFPAMKRSGAYAKRWLADGFESIQQYKVLHIKGKGQFMLNHFPYLDDTDEHIWKYHAFAPRPTPGYVLLHGHVHGESKWTAGGGADEAPQLHVGIDAWGRPLALDEIVEYLESDESKKKFWTLDKYWTDEQ